MAMAGDKGAVILSPKQSAEIGGNFCRRGGRFFNFDIQQVSSMVALTIECLV